MSGAPIAAEVRRFVAQYVHAPEQLDILLLLHAQPEKEWTAADVSRAIFTVPTSATVRLESLAAAGLVTSTGGADPRYRYAPVSAELRAQVDALSRAYRADRVGVIGLVFERRTDPLKSFSDAFRLRKEG